MQIVVILCFLSYAFVHVSSHPNQAPSDSEFTWSMKNSEDEVDDFRSRSDGPLPSVAEFDETENEYKANEVDFDDEDDGYFELTSNKRSPHPVSIIRGWHDIYFTNFVLINDRWCDLRGLSGFIVLETHQQSLRTVFDRRKIKKGKYFHQN